MEKNSSGTDSRNPNAAENHHVGLDTALSVLRLTKSLLEWHGPRISGTKQCLDTAHQIEEMLDVHCDSAAEERFELHPGSMWNLGRIMSAAYFASTVFLIAGCYLISLLLSAFGLFYGITIYIFCGKLFDIFFKKTEGCNAVGIIEPSGDVKQQVIISGHHDSPYTISFLAHLKKLARPRLLLAIATYVFLLLSCLVASLGILFNPTWSMPDFIPVTVVVLGVIFLIPIFFIITRIPSPGAGDNLNASMMVIATAVHFDLQKQKGAPLNHTRLIFLSTDGEEAGQRGAIEFARRHRSELVAIPTFGLNMDSVFTLKDLTFLTRDRNSTCKLSEKMARDCREIASGLGYKIKKTSLPFGSGSTDAAAFASMGVEATSIIGVSPKGDGKIVYHTVDDVVENIEPVAVEATLDIIINYIAHKDSECK